MSEEVRDPRGDAKSPTFGCLSADDILGCARLLDRAPSSDTELDAWVMGPLRDFVGCEKVLFAYGEIVGDQINLVDWRAWGHDPAYLRRLAESARDLKLHTSLAEWSIRRRPFLIDPEHPGPHVSAFERHKVQDHKLRNVVAHGVLNARRTSGTYFSFCDLREQPSAWHLDAVRLIVPALNDLFLGLVAAQRIPKLDLGGLTDAQRNVVGKLVDGRSNKEIARQLAISPKTVINHLTATYAKLGVSGRAELLARMR